MRQLKITPKITNRRDAVEKYLGDVSKFDRLTIEEEVELFKEIESLNPEIEEQNERIKEIKKKLINANLRFVISVAKQYEGSGMPLLDLINEGNIGLAKAVDRFDYKKGFKLISYAVRWIRQKILQFISESSTIKRPMNQENIRKRVQKFKDEYQQKNNYILPSDDEIREALELDEKAYSNYLDARSSIKIDSFDKALTDDSENTLYDLLEDKSALRPDSQIEANSQGEYIMSALKKKLTQKEYEIITQYYGIGKEREKTLEEVAEVLDISRERVRQVRDKALRKLRTVKELYSLFQSLDE